MSAALTAWGRWWAPMFGHWELLLTLANHAFGFGLSATLFTMIYKYMPRQRVGWLDVWLGSAVTSLLFTLGKAAIGWYISSSGGASGFGAASSLLVLLVWVCWSAQVFLRGAEITWVFAHQYGSRRSTVWHRPDDHDGNRICTCSTSLAGRAQRHRRCVGGFLAGI